MKKFLLYFGLPLLTLVCLAAWVLIPTQGPQELKVWLEEKVQRETGYNDLPLHDDGRIDFLTLLNRQASEGVTVENNFMVDLFQTSPPLGTDPYRRNYKKWLGNPSDYTGKKIEALEDFLERSGKGKLSESQLYSELSNLLDKMEHPWTKGDLPKSCEWLNQNQQPLDRIVEASKKPRFFSPMLSGDGKTSQVLFLNEDFGFHLRKVAELLSYRCYQSIGEEKLKPLISDLSALRRISMLMDQTVTHIERLIGVSIGTMATNAEKEAIKKLDWTTQQIDRYCKLLEQMKKPVSMVKCSKLSQKYLALDVVQNLAMGVISGDEFESKLDVSSVNWVDIGKKCELMEQWEVDVQSVVDPVAAATDHRYKSVWVEEVVNGSFLYKEPFYQRFLPSVQNRTDHVARKLVSTFLLAAFQMRNACFRAHANLRGTYLALKLEKFRLMYGQYPKSLEEVKCAGFPEAKLDYYTGKPTKYRRVENLKDFQTGYWFLSIGHDGTNDSCDKDGIPLSEPNDYDDVFWRVIKKKVEIHNVKTRPTVK